jgi:hypothetical protein
MLNIRTLRRGQTVRFDAARGHNAGTGAVEAVTSGDVMVRSEAGLIRFMGRARWTSDNVMDITAHVIEVNLEVVG